jgi:hypothetical protein
MKISRMLLVSLFVAGASIAVRASDPTALYARIDKVVLEPAAGAPEMIQVWGVFSMAKPDDRNEYLPAARGYLYFKVAADPDTARKEWEDLRSVAGSGQIVSFGSRYQLKGRLRKASDQPAAPDQYTVSIGITNVRGNTDYAPIRALLDYKD